METNVQYSIMQGNVKCEQRDATTLKELAQAATEHDISCGVFNNGLRRNENFLKADTIALDVDEGIGLEEAKKLFDPYAHAILTTRNHQKEKNGKVADRFRVLLKLEKAIDNAKDYYNTWYSLKNKFPFIDDACKDPARFFYRSPKIEVLKESGKTIKPVSESKLKINVPGKLARTTIDFLTNGAEQGQRHNALYKASRDFHEQGGSMEEFCDLMQQMIDETGNWGTAHVNNKDMETIEDAFSKPPRYEPRTTEEEVDPFNFVKIGDLLKQNSQINWMVDGLLTAGGLSLLVGPPKAGKSTLTRQLAKSITRGEPFLGRNTKEGRVLYLALEEQAELLNQQFRTIGITDDDDILIHVGGIFSNDKIKFLERAIESNNPTLVIIDTLFLFAQFENGNNYDEVNKTLQNYRELARRTGTHIICIHHQNKGEDKGAGSIMGSSAIHGAVDCAIIFNKHGNTRNISTSQRGGNPFDKQSLIFDKDTETYAIGKVKNNGF